MDERVPLLQQLTTTEEFAPGIETPPDTPERLDTFEGIYALEQRYRALGYLQGRYNLATLSPLERALAPITQPMHGVDQISNQFAPRLLDAYMQEDPEAALETFRNIEAHTTDQQMALLMNDGEFHGIRTGLHQHLEEIDAEMRSDVEERLGPKGQIAFNDRYQFNGNESRRSLRNMLLGGITLQVDPESADLLADARDKVGSGPLPLTEILKNEKMVAINGLKDSKISLAVHDAMDHLWLFNLMHERGLHQKYGDFFQSIGDPSYTDIYKREGEIVASIGFGVRCNTAQEPGFVPIHDASVVLGYFEKYFDDGELSDRHMDAFRILRRLTPHSREWQSFGFTYSNNVVELDEQRRKHGKIKVRDNETHEVTGEFSETDPDYLSLFTELHHELNVSKNKTRNNLFRFHILLEEYLQGIAQETVPMDTPFNVKVQHLDEYAVDQTTVPADRLRWMFRNYGFTATKDNWV